MFWNLTHALPWTTIKSIHDFKEGGVTEDDDLELPLTSRPIIMTLKHDLNQKGIDPDISGYNQDDKDFVCTLDSG